MKLKQSIMLQSLLIAAVLPLVLLSSRPIALQPDTTYQTGTQIILSSNFAFTAEQVFNIPYVSVMTTSSLNASLAIYGVDYYMVSGVFGWKLYVASLTSSNLIIHLSVFSATSPLYYLKLCYIISSNPDIDINYVEYTFSRNIFDI
jgi:hypothetical protein